MRLDASTARSDFHGFPRVVDNYAQLGRRQTFIGGDGVSRVKVSLDGGYFGKEGHFEWIIEPNKSVNHRLFVPNKNNR